MKNYHLTSQILDPQRLLTASADLATAMAFLLFAASARGGILQPALALPRIQKFLTG